MALLAVQDASDGAQSVTFQAAAGGGDQVPRGARAGGWSTGVVLLVRNTDVATKTVTATGPAGVTRQFVVPVTTGFAVIPVYGFGTAALEAITYSAVTGVTVAAVR
ncbi:MAG: hypothetical protein ACREF4_09470, partial [Gammaproteobacteria bacterium]